MLNDSVEGEEPNFLEKYRRIGELFEDRGVNLGDKLELLVKNSSGENLLGFACPGYIFAFRFHASGSSLHWAFFSPTIPRALSRQFTSVSLTPGRDSALSSFGNDTHVIGYRLVETCPDYLKRYFESNPSSVDERTFQEARGRDSQPSIRL